MPRTTYSMHASAEQGQGWVPLCGTRGGPGRKSTDAVRSTPHTAQVTCRRCRAGLGLEMLVRQRRGPVRDYRFTTWDFRFLQAWVQKLDLADAWSRYQSHLGQPHVRRTRQRGIELLRQLAAVATRLGESGAAALLRDAELIRLEESRAQPALDQVPTLEEFRESLYDPDFYSERELVERWQDLYGLRSSSVAGASRRDALRTQAQARRGRLLTRQLGLLQRLERAVAVPPGPDDPLAAWMQPAVAARLARAGVVTIGDLRRRVSDRGTGWFHGVPRLGRSSARSIEAWLSRHAIEEPAPDRTAETILFDGAPVLAPLERLELTGEAVEDFVQVQSWLKGVAESDSRHTWRAFRKEAERLLLWTILERRVRLTAITAADAHAYLEFLTQPPNRWRAPRGTSRASTAWRPFEGPLGPGSQHTAVAVLRLMFDDLMPANNPWRKIAIGRTEASPC